MRISLTGLAALVGIVLSFQQPLAAQSPWYVQQPSAAAYGYYAPAPAAAVDALPASYYAGRPDVDGDACGCDSGACDSRIECCGRANGCNCLGCRRGDIFSRAFAEVDYLIWYNNGIFLPPLVTTNNPIPAQPLAGVLPGATTLFGGGDIDSDRQSGVRLTAGLWLDDECNLAAAGKIYGVENGTVRFGAAGDGTTVLGRPFFNSDPVVNREDAILISYPGLSNGFVAMTASNDVAGGELYLRSLLDHGANYRLDLLGGWQFTRIDSDLVMHSQHDQGPTRFIYDDLFATENTFNGGTLGLYGEMYHDILTISAMGKIGVGMMHQEVLVAGSSSTTIGGIVTPAVGGLLALPTNMGGYSRDVLTWSPEVNVKLSYAMTRRLSVSVGYTFLYWTRVSFAGDQIDRAVNATQLNGGALVGPARPAFNFRDSDFWVQTIDLGLSWNY